MGRALLGKKLGMTQIFDGEGNVVPVTVLQVEPNVIVLKRTSVKDGYEAIQLGYGQIKPQHVNKPMQGHYAKAEVKPRKLLREFRVEDAGQYEVGQELAVDTFKEGDLVDVSGKSRGKGFAGVIKRHGHSRGPMSHGSKYHRGVGSMGASADPSRVFKGKKLPGRMGGKKVTVQGLDVVRVDVERDLLLVRGSVPGAKGSYVTIKESVKA